MSQKGADIIVLTGSPEEAESLSRQYPGLTILHHRHDDVRPVTGKKFVILITAQSPDPWKNKAETIWPEALYQAGAAKVHLYWPTDQLALCSQWSQGGLTEAEFRDRLSQAPVIEPPPRPRPIQAIKVHEGSGRKYLASDPEPPDWALKDSLPLCSLAVIVAPPGTGKGFLAMQLGAHLAAAKRFFEIWEIERPFRVLYLTGEESGRTVHARAHGVLARLPIEVQEEAAGLFWAFSVAGCVHLVEPDGQGGLRPTESYGDLDRLIDRIGPDIVFLDTFSRLVPTPENDNPAVTAACGLLEELIAKHECAIVLLHHTNKTVSSLVNAKDELYTALGQAVVRGASALPACARWVANMAPLSEEFARKVIGERAQGQSSGKFVALRVSKKNEGPSEAIHYLEHGEGGFFEQVEPAGPDSEMSDAERLIEEVRRREEAGEPPLAEKTAGQTAFRWGWTRSKKATEKALETGLLVAEKKPSGRGYILRTAGSNPPFPQFPQENGVFDFENENN